MRPKDKELGDRLEAQLVAFDREKRGLPGVSNANNRWSFVEQLVESIRRIRYISVIASQDISEDRADPHSPLFDPLKAAALSGRRGDSEEAFWLVFLSVHFGKHRRTGWRLVREIYGGLDEGRWTWARISSNPEEFNRWLAAHEGDFSGHFGNHRKYETLKASSKRGTGRVMESYVGWVKPPRTHQILIEEARDKTGGNPRGTFDYLYCSMSAVLSFGRTAKFDYLTMVGKLGLATIEPGSTYMQGATGPVKGARLLFGGSMKSELSPKHLDEWLVELEADLDVGMQGMQVLEDALCNWQKSPEVFKPFRG